MWATPQTDSFRAGAETGTKEGLDGMAREDDGARPTTACKRAGKPQAADLTTCSAVDDADGRDTQDGGDQNIG